MTQPVNHELDALDALLRSEGWKLWCAWYEAEWGSAAFARKVADAIGDSQMEPHKAVALLQQTSVALKAVEGLRQWPERRVQYLKQQMKPQEPNMSRRGPGL